MVYCKNGRGCEGIILLSEETDPKNVRCTICDFCFCAMCDLPPHAPISCQMAQQWEAKGGFLEASLSEAEQEARKLVLSMTKPWCELEADSHIQCIVYLSF